MWARRYIYYTFKPCFPKILQLKFRRLLIQSQLKKCSHIWPINERAGIKPAGWPGWPEGKKFALVLTHDVETKHGFDKCHQLVQLEKGLGFRSSFNFVPERYDAVPEFRGFLISSGFEVGVHGLKHDGKLFQSRKIFNQRAVRINQYLRDWGAVGFRAPAMHHNLEWIHDLQIEYDASTFDTDPFEPQPDPMETIFPFKVQILPGRKAYIELPYTLAQDSTLFIYMNEKKIDIWTKKLAWIVKHGGMALVNVHPDYMNFDRTKLQSTEYPAELYVQFLEHVQSEYGGQYWNALPREVARYSAEECENIALYQKDAVFCRQK